MYEFLALVAVLCLLYIGYRVALYVQQDFDSVDDMLRRLPIHFDPIEMTPLILVYQYQEPEQYLNLLLALDSEGYTVYRNFLYGVTLNEKAVTLLAAHNLTPSVIHAMSDRAVVCLSYAPGDDLRSEFAVRKLMYVDAPVFTPGLPAEA